MTCHLHSNLSFTSTCQQHAILAKTETDNDNTHAYFRYFSPEVILFFPFSAIDLLFRPNFDAPSVFCPSLPAISLTQIIPKILASKYSGIYRRILDAKYIPSTQRIEMADIDGNVNGKYE